MQNATDMIAADRTPTRCQKRKRANGPAITISRCLSGGHRLLSEVGMGAHTMQASTRSRDRKYNQVCSPLCGITSRIEFKHTTRPLATHQRLVRGQIDRHQREEAVDSDYRTQTPKKNQTSSCLAKSCVAIAKTRAGDHVSFVWPLARQPQSSVEGFVGCALCCRDG